MQKLVEYSDDISGKSPLRRGGKTREDRRGESRVASAVLGSPERLALQALNGHIVRIFLKFYVSQLPKK